MWGKILVFMALGAGCNIEYDYRSLAPDPPADIPEKTTTVPDDRPWIDIDTGTTPDPTSEIEVTPLTYGFGDCLLECPTQAIIEIKSVGDLDLIVDKLYYSGPADLVLNVDYLTYGGLPWILTPGSSNFVSIEYTPGFEDYHLGYLTVESNDLTDPVVIAGQDGAGIRHGTKTDEFIQEEQLELDILFVIDNSCSMLDEQTGLALNSDLFITPLTTSGADFHIGTITTDSPNFRGPVITPATPDIISEFQNQIVAGTGGSATEKGLEMAADSLLMGDASPFGTFLRDAANLVVVIVSDEDDSGFDVVADHVADMKSVKDLSVTTFSLHSVAGTYPSSPCATPAFRYDEAVYLGGGQFFDICTSDWGYQVEQIAEDSLSSVLNYPLSEDPIIDSIIVYDDGVPVLSGWSYDPYTNSVIFDTTSVPEVDSLVSIEYGHYGECP